MPSLSTHLLDMHQVTQQHTRMPFSSYAPQSQMAYAGPMSYNPSMHGGFTSSMPFPTLVDPSTLPPDPTYYDISVATHKQIASLQVKLDQKLGPEYISQRPGPGGGPKLTYAEGWKIINLANEVFGFNGWSSSICSLNVDYLDAHDEGRRWNCGVSAVVRVNLRDGVYHEDVGYGTAENVKSKGAALEKCKKEAITDAVKRTLRNFGNLMGNCLYDKQYTQEIVKIKVQPPKFNRSALHRRPEFEEGASGSGDNKTGTSTATTASTTKPGGMAPPPPPEHAMKPPLVHIKSEQSLRKAVQKQSRTRPTPGAQPAVPVPPTRPSSPSTSMSTSASIEPVPPANEPSVDPDEASYFNSDDDALLMQLDMENGRSIVVEEDRPIEYDDETIENNFGARVNQDEAQNMPIYQQSFGASTDLSSGPPSNPINADSETKQGQAQAQPEHLPGQPQAKQHLAQQQLQTRPLQPQAGQQMAQQQTSRQQQSLHNQSYHSNQRNRPVQPRPPKSVQAQRNITSHSPAPPIGGFHFPPGVDLSSRPQSHAPGSATVPDRGIPQLVGMKRAADVMSSGGCPPIPHANQTHVANDKNSTSKPRVPFAPLEVGEGGDMKRMRL